MSHQLSTTASTADLARALLQIIKTQDASAAAAATQASPPQPQPRPASRRTPPAAHEPVTRAGRGGTEAKEAADGPTYTLPFSAMTASMPSLFFGLMNPGGDAEDLAAALLQHWGVPAEIRVMARTERKGGYGGMRFATRWRSVRYDAEGNPLSVTLRDLHGVHTFDYDAEHEYRLVGGAGAAEGAEGADDDRNLIWGKDVEEYDGNIYEPTGQRMAFVELHKWYSPTCDPVRQALLNGDQVVLNADPDVTKNWRFYKCVMGHKRQVVS